MKGTKTAPGEQKRLFTWVSLTLHRRVKAAAAMAGKTQEKYMRELIATALDREEAKEETA